MSTQLAAWLMAGFVLMTACSSGAGPPTESVVAEATVESSAADLEPIQGDQRLDDPDRDLGAEPTPDPDTGSGGPAEPAADEGSPADEYVSPVFDALGVDLDAWPELAAARFERHEEFVQQCMLEQGFDYQPAFNPVPPSQRRRAELSRSLSTEQFRYQYGFGASTLVALDYENEGLLGFVDQLVGPPPDAERSPAEQEAYEIALTGRSVVSGGDTDEGFGFKEGSCRQRAWDGGQDTAPDRIQAFFELLGEEYEAVYDRANADPRVGDLTADWQSCMAEAGHSYEHWDDIQDKFWARSFEMADRLGSHPSTLEILGLAQAEGLAGMVEADRLEFLETHGLFEGFARVPELQAELDELAADEIRVASDSWDCSKPHQQTLIDVLKDHESQFLQDHGDQIALLANS